MIGAARHTAAEFRWHPDGRPFSRVRAADEQYLTWICRNGHEYRTRPAAKSKTVRPVCSFCSGKKPIAGVSDIATTHPEAARMWHPTLNRGLKPTSLSAGSAKWAWWRCPAGHEFEFRINLFWENPTCRQCWDPNRNKLTVDLTAEFPEYARQWDTTRNATPEPPKSLLKKVDRCWWQCDQDDSHYFEATVSDRQRRAGRCPICSHGRVAIGINDLPTTDPEVADEWDYARNGDLRPEEISRGCQEKVWWICRAKGHSFDAVVATRTRLGVGCTICSGRRAVIGESDLPAVNPGLARRWNVALNAGTAAGVHPGSGRLVWWDCICGVPYQAEVRAMREDRYCRACTDKIRWHGLGRPEIPPSVSA
jgi:hypothetical protein